MSYLDQLAANRSGPEQTAAAKPRSRFRKEPRKDASLTAPRKRAKLRVKRSATKQPGKETRGTTKKTPSEKAKMAKKSKRSKKRRSAAQRAATRKMLAANKAKRSGRKAKRRGSSKRKARRSSKRTGRKSAKRVAAGKKAARTRKRHKAEKREAARKGGKRKARKSGKRRARKSGKRKSRSSKRRAKRTAVKVVRLPRKASRVVVVSAPPKARRRRRKAGKRKAARRGKRRMYNRRSRSAAMENPMDGLELFIGAITGLAGFLTADVLDRFLATHPLTVATAANGGTPATYTDTPPTTGDYAGLFNATAICAPMDATRWLAGLGVATVPLVIAHFISAPEGRAALQFFGYAAGIRIVGKGLIDMVAQLTQPTQLGQQLYDGEMRAAALQAGSGTIASGVNLPSSGLGRARLGTGKPCAPCTTKKMGAGYPSAPREVSAVTNNTTPTTQNQPTPSPVNTAPTAPTSAVTPPAPPAAANTLTGLRRLGTNGIPRRNPNWGYQGDE